MLAPVLYVLGLVSIVTFSQPVRAQVDKGHQIVDNKVIITTSTHWQNWEIPTHAVDINTLGVKPRFFRDRYNILDDLETFRRKLPELRRRRSDIVIPNIDSTEKRDLRGEIVTKREGGKDVPVYTYFVKPGISRVGSNPRSATNIFDRDVSTYWEPDPLDPIEKWWIEVDLGRAVPVDELILRFADEETGEPFRQFKIVTSPKQDPVMQNAQELKFTVAGGTDKPNLDQRVLSIPLQDDLRAAPGWTGRMVETIRIVVTDTRGNRYAMIPEEEWSILERVEQGDVVYFVKDPEGSEEPIEKEEYERLPFERKGRKDYYRRERPRLTEIEVWGFGDNISPGIIAGGGSFSLPPNIDFLSPPAFAFDGDFGTIYQHQIPTSSTPRGLLTVDLGAIFWLDAIRISATEGEAGCECDHFDGYIHRSSEGSRSVAGGFNWEPLSLPEREDNATNRFQQIFDAYDPPRRLRFLEMRIVTRDDPSHLGIGGAGIAEYQLFSRGYPAEVVLTSDLIEVPLGSSLGRISWTGETPTGTDLDLRTRTGDIVRKVIHYFNKTTGEEVKKSAWDNLLHSWRGTDTSFVPTSGWSPWSRSYQHPGMLVTSPGGRRFMQIQVKLQTEIRDVAASIGAVEVELGKLVGERIVAELWPTQISIPGQMDTFEVFIQPNFIERPVGSRSLGFDEMLLVMAAGKSMELLELCIDVNSQSGEARQVFHSSEATGVFVDESGIEMQVFHGRGDSLWIRLPTTINILPGGEGSRTYNRITIEGDQVPVDHEGLPLSGASYGLLEEEEQGDIRYFRKTGLLSGRTLLTEVEQLEYGKLEEEERGPIRYFRILLGDGAQFPFDIDGDSLDAEAYNRLDRDSRGMIVGPGPLLRVRFKALVFLNGTTLHIAVRNTAGGTDRTALWQGIVPGDAASLIDGNTLSISIPLKTNIIEEFSIAPNPFTPNGDGINDEIDIHLSVFKLTTSRAVEVRIYTLAGHCMFETSRMISSGSEVIPWNGTDRYGQKVPPGVYICQIKLDTDSQDIALSRVIAVVY